MDAEATLYLGYRATHMSWAPLMQLYIFGGISSVKNGNDNDLLQRRCQPYIVHDSLQNLSLFTSHIVFTFCKTQLGRRSVSQQSLKIGITNLGAEEIQKAL